MGKEVHQSGGVLGSGRSRKKQREIGGSGEGEWDGH